jgi:polar amino acid transport system substrate-binding protein
MYQVVQYQKDGKMSVQELPAPMCIKEGILVRNEYSLISAGTEKTSVSNAQGSLLSRAKKQPEQVKLVMDFVKKEGLLAAYNKVRSKLDSFKTLGYSCAGVVVESSCPEFAPGDRVACAGAGYASHSEYVSIPKNLAVKIPANVSLADASFATVASIAMQGVRQAAPQLGENVAVIGLGLIGQITIQLLKAAGCKVAGLDVNKSLFDTAKSFNCDECFESSAQNIKSLMSFSDGIGFDSVIITASTSSSQPVDLAMKIARKRGKVVIVGAVGMNINRSPFYEKEIDFKISCSYGPGRYDSNYELLGQDYHPGFVRWTENRNMQSVIKLIADGKLNVKDLTTHTFDVKKAEDAYKLISGEIKEKYLGILIKYPERANSEAKSIQIKSVDNKGAKAKIAFIGAGIFGQNYLIPALQKTKAELIGVSTATPVNAQSVAKKFGFAISSTDSKALINHKDVSAVFCSSQHDSHSDYVLEAINACKPIFVEKPLCVNREQLALIDEAVNAKNGKVMVGFNRRFSKPFVTIKDFFAKRSDPMNISYRVNAGFIPKSHWLYHPNQGMGRIIGEGCHFIDCMAYLCSSRPVSVFAYSLGSNNSADYNYDNSTLVIKFEDGSVGCLEYYANGDSSVPKEYCEVFCEGSVAQMHNFEEVKLFRACKTTNYKFDGKKGHNEEVAETIKAIECGNAMPIDYSTIRAITLATFAAIESINSGVEVKI